MLIRNPGLGFDEVRGGSIENLDPAERLLTPLEEHPHMPAYPIELSDS